MKRSIKHLPKRTQDELNAILELVLHHVPWCSMVVLYGSYARGNYVLWDEHWEQGMRVSYQSDYDMMLVIDSKGVKHTEHVIRDKVEPKYEQLMAGKRHAKPQFIVETIDVLNKALERKQYFFTDIVKQGIRIYDTGAFVLAKPRQLSFTQIKELAAMEYSIFYPDGVSFLEGGAFYLDKTNHKIGSFMLHQACERFYNAIALVFTNYRPHTHKLKELAAQLKEFSRKLTTVFPADTEFQARCYDLICRSYIEARYNINFAITKQELMYMLERVEVLRQITQEICTAKIASYDAEIENE